MASSEVSAEVLSCPYCGLEVTVSRTAPVHRGRNYVSYETVTHPVPGCLGFRETRKDRTAYLELARQGVNEKRA
jgi:hypothetical protein